jgi:hypothetical protein
MHYVRIGIDKRYNIGRSWRSERGWRKSWTRQKKTCSPLRAGWPTSKRPTLGYINIFRGWNKNLGGNQK